MSADITTKNVPTLAQDGPPNLREAKYPCCSNCSNLKMVTEYIGQCRTKHMRCDLYGDAWSPPNGGFDWVRLICDDYSPDERFAKPEGEDE